MPDLIGRTLGHYRIVEGPQRLQREDRSIAHLNGSPKLVVNHIAVTDLRVLV
jgi:hypothetical protein